MSAEPGGIGAGVSGGWFEGDLVAEGFELADVAAFALFRVDAGGVEVAAEVVVAGAGVGEQVPGLSTCPGRGLTGQLDSLLRTSLPGKTVTGQDPASLDRLDHFQRGQGPVVILVQEPGEQLRPGLAAGKAERRQRVAHHHDVKIGRAHV